MQGYGPETVGGDIVALLNELNQIAFVMGTSFAAAAAVWATIGTHCHTRPHTRAHARTHRRTQRQTCPRPHAHTRTNTYTNTTQNYGPEAVGGDIVALLNELNQSAFVMGTSFAAAAAVWAAAEAPSRISGIILAGPFVRDIPIGFAMSAALKVGDLFACDRLGLLVHACVRA